MSETQKIYYCPRCQSPDVYAGCKLIDQHFGVIQVFAGCNNCRGQWANIAHIKR